jgi:four helix bundle protein
VADRYKKEIKEWTFDFGVKVVKCARALEKSGVSFSLCNQFLRSGTSVGANVHEGKASSTVREYVRFLGIAARSANECDYWARLISASFDVQSAEIKSISAEVREIIKVLNTIILKLKQKQALSTVSEAEDFFADESVALDL